MDSERRLLVFKGICFSPYKRTLLHGRLYVFGVESPRGWGWCGESIGANYGRKSLKVITCRVSEHYIVLELKRKYCMDIRKTIIKASSKSQPHMYTKYIRSLHSFARMCLPPSPLPFTISSLSQSILNVTLFRGFWRCARSQRSSYTLPSDLPSALSSK